MKVEYIIVGAGLAGLCFAQYCSKMGKSFIVFDNESRSSSKVAGGMFNPLVLKRFTSIWESQAQLDTANVFYPEIERLIDKKVYFKLPIYRKFASVEEQNNWFVACDQPLTAPYLNPKIYKERIPNIKSDFFYGEVFNTGFLNVKLFVESYQQLLSRQQKIKFEDFEYDKLNLSSDQISYKNLQAKHLIFAEGFSIEHNPFFNFLPLDGTKGELLYVKIPDLKLKEIIKSNVFIIPLDKDIYKVGATYNWQDKTDKPTNAAKNELIEGLEALIDCPYEIIEHVAGVRPTVKDRRPLVGAHYQHQNIYILNGLGTRGVLLGPYLADKLINNIENKVPLDKNIDVSRYYKKLQLIK